MSETVTTLILTVGGPPLPPEPETEEEEMPFDLAAGIGQLVLTETSANLQQANNVARNGFVTANNVLQFGAVRQATETDLIEGRTASGILATPIASPTTQ